MNAFGAQRNSTIRALVGVCLVLTGLPTQAQTLRAFLRFADRSLTRKVEANLVRAGLDRGCSIHLTEMLRQRGPVLLASTDLEPSLKELLEGSLQNMEPKQIENLGVLVHSSRSKLQTWMPSFEVNVSDPHRSFDIERLSNWILEDLEIAGYRPISVETTDSGLRLHGPSPSLRFVMKRWGQWAQHHSDLQVLAAIESRLPELAAVEETLGDLIEQRAALLKALPMNSGQTASAEMKSLATEHGTTRDRLFGVVARLQSQLSDDEKRALGRVFAEQRKVTDRQLKDISKIMSDSNQRNADGFLLWATVESRNLEAMAWQSSLAVSTTASPISAQNP